MTVDKVERQVLNVQKGLSAYVADDFIGYFVIDYAHQPLRRTSRRNDAAKQNKLITHSLKVDVASRNDTVNDIAENYRSPQIACNGDEGKYYCQYYRRAVWTELL